MIGTKILKFDPEIPEIPEIIGLNVGNFKFSLKIFRLKKKLFQL